MSAPRHTLLFGNAQATISSSEEELLGAMNRAKRPINDATFTSRSNVHSRAYSMTLGSHRLAIAAGSPVRFETREDPQYTLLMPIAGSGRITDGRNVIRFGGKSIVRSSFHNPLTLENIDYSVLTIRTDLHVLLNALGIEAGDHDAVRDILFNIGTRDETGHLYGCDHHSAFTSIMRMIDDAQCDQVYLRKVGIDRLLTNMIALLTQQLNPEISRFVRNPSVIASTLRQ